MTRAATVKEADVLASCLSWLEANGYEHWRVNTGPVVRGGGFKSKRFMTPSPTKGFPDIAGILKKRSGIFWACEVKTDVGKLRPEQEQWIKRLKDAGAVAFVARSAEQLAALLAVAEEG